MKRKLFGIAVVAGVLSMLAYGTLAYFTTQETAHNVITSGGISIDLLEWANVDKTVEFPEGGIENVMPGTTATKILEVENTGPDTGYIRVKVEEAIQLVNEEDEADLDFIGLDFNTEYWTEQDGYYYYNYPLASGETTAPLFTTVSFSKDMGNSYQNCTVEIDVTAYAVQVANNGDSALTAIGWPAETEEEIVEEADEITE